MIVAERFGRSRIRLATGLEFDLEAEVRAIPGATPWRIKGAFAGWSFPLELSVCRELRAILGSRLEIGPNLWEWAEDKVATEKQLSSLLDLDLRETVDLPSVRRLAPTMWKAMKARGFQTVGARFLASAGAAVLADQPGLGKTIEVFGALIERGISGNVLVLAPSAAVSTTWSHEPFKWLGDLRGGIRVVTATGTRAQRSEAFEYFDQPGPERFKFLVCNPQMVRLQKQRVCPKGTCDGSDFTCTNARRHRNRDATGVAGYDNLFEGSLWEAALLDESHMYLVHANPRAKNPSQVGYGLQRLPVRPIEEGGMRVAMTGTPLRGKPRLLWPTLAWVDPRGHTSQHTWNERWFVHVPNRYTFSGVQVTDDIRPELEEEFGQMLDSIMLRRTKDELYRINPAWAPPSKAYQEVWVQLDPKHRKAYAELERGVAAQLPGGSLMTDGVLSQMTRLKQMAGCYGRMDGETFVPSLPSPKLDWLLEFLSSLGIERKPYGTDKVIVATQFRQFAELWQAELHNKGIPSHLFTGQTSDRDKARMQKEFQAPGGPRVFMLTTQAGGVSLTLDAADWVVIMDETWIPDEQEQVEDRAHRTSRVDHSVTVVYVRAEDTIENEVGDANLILDYRQKRVLDVRRGVEYARRLREEIG